MDAEIKIRDAVEADLDMLVSFNSAMALETEGKTLDDSVLSPGMSAVLADDSMKLGFYLVAEIDGAVVGSLMVTPEWSDWRNGWFWWVQSVYVAPASRGRGVYRTLYGEVRHRARNRGDVVGTRLYVAVENTSAQRVYARLGMVEPGYRFFEEMM